MPFPSSSATASTTSKPFTTRPGWPDGADRDIHDWFWSKTAMGALTMALAHPLRDDDDEAAKAVAYGIAR